MFGFLKRDPIKAINQRRYRAAYWGTRSIIGPVATYELHPFGVHRHERRIFAAGYLLIRDLYLADGVALNRFEREIVGMGTSVSNSCYFCSHNHAALVGIEDSSVVKAIFGKAPQEIEDPRQRDLATYALGSRRAHLAVHKDPTLTKDELSDAAVTVFLFHYINRIMDGLGPTGMALEFAAKPPSFALARVLRYHKSSPPGEAMKRFQAAHADESQAEVSEADRSEMERWSGGRPKIADAATLAWALIQEATEDHIDEPVLETIRAHVDAWDGSDAELGSPWLNEAVAGLQDPTHREQAKQALILAREGFRSDRKALVAACEGDKARQVALVAYTAFATALSINRRLTL